MDPIKIMVVEDSNIISKYIQMSLKTLGYEVLHIATSGEEALSQIEECLPDLILMDIMLEGKLDGIEVASIIKKKFSIPVVYLTAHSEIEILERAKLTEPFGYLIKPFKIQDLQISIEVALHKYKMNKILEDNMEEARIFQQKLLPSTLPRLDKVKIHAKYHPAIKVGGDLYDIFQIGSYLFIFIADVCGHGVPAAMMATYIKAHIKHYVCTEQLLQPNLVLHNLKNIISNELLFEGKFVTAIACCIDTNSLVMKYSNAGHCYPFILRNGEILTLSDGNPLIAELQDEIVYKQHTLQLCPKDQLLFYTDGIYEWKKDKKIFGISNFKEYIMSRNFGKEAIDDLINLAQTEQAIEDDISYILLEF